MFQTIGHKGGFVQLSYFGAKQTITAWAHGNNLGEFRTVAAAKGAITKAHRRWLSERDAEHYNYLRSLNA